MKVYDFSDCEFDNEILSDTNTGILLSKKFDYHGQKESRVIVSNLEEEKRLVFLINCQEKNSMMNYLSEIKAELLESME